MRCVGSLGRDWNDANYKIYELKRVHIEIFLDKKCVVCRSYLINEGRGFDLLIVNNISRSVFQFKF